MPGGFREAPFMRGKGMLSDRHSLLRYTIKPGEDALDGPHANMYAAALRRHINMKGRTAIVRMTATALLQDENSDAVPKPTTEHTFKATADEADRSASRISPFAAPRLILQRFIKPTLDLIDEKTTNWNKRGTGWTLKAWLTVTFEFTWEQALVNYGSLAELPAELQIKNARINNRNGSGEGDCFRLAIELALWWHHNPHETKCLKLASNGYPVHANIAILKQLGDTLDWTGVPATWVAASDVQRLTQNNPGLFIEQIPYKSKQFRQTDGSKARAPSFGGAPPGKIARDATIHLQLLDITVTKTDHHFVALGPGALGAIEVFAAILELIRLEMFSPN